MKRVIVFLGATFLLCVAGTGATLNYQYAGEWGEQGNGPGQFGDAAMSVAVAPNGDVYCTDDSNYRVQYFDPDGTYQTASSWSLERW
ncbi:MAG: hypothetical protein JSW52_00920 [Candidatus Coatesbacteria bacterium]|nr:MAG: hypothetical protein JSW52_00920 [Candidatus Coatesbacteria bacterium]